MTITASTLSPFEQRISELLETDDINNIERFIAELEGYGIESEEQIDDAYYGCYPSESSFVEDFVEDCYSEQLKMLPMFMQTALDYEMMWHQSFQYDFISIYNRDSHEYYFFNRNF